MLRKVKDLICPKCGANDPIFVIKYLLRAYVTDEKKNHYDFSIYNDFDDMYDIVDDSIFHGYAECECSRCGTKIDYYIEDDKK